jgi:hypothetical protein
MKPATSEPAAAATSGDEAGTGRGEGRRAPSGLVIAAALLAFVAGGAFLERHTYFDRARDTLRGRAGPAGMPDEGSVGRAVARALERYGANAGFWRRPEALPSSLVLTPEQVAGELPVISIVADDDHLYDPDVGLMTNMSETGPDWERLAWASLWEHGELVAGSRAGLRIQGDSSRYLGDPSFRLLFRPMYGASSVTGGRFLGADADPAAAVVVHVVRYRGLYTDVFVFEIARRLGLPTVDFRPARTFLNGEERGVYVLTERVMPDGWGLTHFGDPDFYMYVYKGETKQPSRDAHAALTEWASAAAPLTMQRAAERIDVDNLTRHLFTLMFCFTTDWAQGAALLDRNDPEARWFWLHWDMDQSFDERGIAGIEPWEQPFMELITLEAELDELKILGIVTDARHTERHTGDVRRLIFLRLLESPEYRDHFVRVATDILNHELTPAYFSDLLARYEHLAESAGVYGGFDLGEYLRRRPDFARAAISRYFGLPDPVTVTVDAPPSTTLMIDGYPEGDTYSGRYYPGQSLTIEPGAGGPAVAGWQVGDRRVEGERLQVVVEQPLTIHLLPLPPGGDR